MKMTARIHVPTSAARVTEVDWSTLDEQSLVAAIVDRSDAARSGRAWVELMTRHEPLINKRVRRLIGNCARMFRASDTFDEIKMEVSMALVGNDMRRLRAFDARRGTLAAWVGLIAHQTAVTHLSRLSREVPSAIEAVDEDCDAGYGDNDRDNLGDGQEGARWIALAPF